MLGPAIHGVLASSKGGAAFVGEDWDVSGASYASKSKDITSEEPAQPGAVFFGDNGTKMYMLGLANDTVFQYALSTAWDVSTAVYASKSFSVTSQETNPTALYFSDDGTKMYVGGTANDTVFQYTLSVAWDVSTASYASKSKDISSEGISLVGVAFDNTGTRMYCSNNPDDVFQYTLSTAWDVSTAVYASKAADTSAQGVNPYGLRLSPGGTHMFVILGTTQRKEVYQYNLPTTWDISSAVYSGKMYDFSAQETFAVGLDFSDDGTKMYVLGDFFNIVYQYTLPTPSP